MTSISSCFRQALCCCGTAKPNTANGTNQKVNILGQQILRSYTELEELAKQGMAGKFHIKGFNKPDGTNSIPNDGRVEGTFTKVESGYSLKTKGRHGKVVVFTPQENWEGKSITVYVKDPSWKLLLRPQFNA